MPDVMGSQPHRTGINSEIVHHNLDSPPGTIVLGSEVNAVNPPWSSFQPSMMIPNMCIHGFLYNRAKSPPLWGSGARLTPVILSPRQLLHVAVSDAKQRNSWTPVIHWPLGQSLKTSPAFATTSCEPLRDYYTHDLFSELVVLASKTNEEQVQL